jgi:hypothetical protein
MHLFYYDEVKYHPPQQTSFWLGGICASSLSVSNIEEQVNAVSLDAFGESLLMKETEFHGIEICRGKGTLKGFPEAERLEYLRRLLAIIAREDVYRVYVEIRPANITHSSRPPDEIAFMYLTEQVNSLMGDFDTVGMMFGDYDEPAIGSSVASLSGFRRGGTDWSRGRGIDRIIDTVHFAKSHHSRMIQLADIYMYCLQFSHQANDAPWRNRIAEVINASGIAFATKCRTWPTQAQWYR